MNSPVLATDPTGMLDRTIETGPQPPGPPPGSKVQGVLDFNAPSVTKTKSWAGTETKTTKVEETANTKTTTTNVTGNSAGGASVTLRGTAGHETTTTTETSHGVLTTQVTETHKEGILKGSGGFSQNGLEAGGTATAVEHGFTFTGSIPLGSVKVDLPGIGVTWGIGAGAKVEVGKGDSGRVEASAKASVGESVGIKFLPGSISRNN